MFGDTKGVIRIRISKKNRQHNGRKKKYKGTNNDLQNARLCKLQKGCTRLAAASDISLLIASPWSVVISGNSGSSTTKTNCPDIAEILLKVPLNTINQPINKFHSRTKTSFNSLSCAKLMLGCRKYYVYLYICDRVKCKYHCFSLNCFYVLINSKQCELY
jgi:hypothetical protein